MDLTGGFVLQHWLDRLGLAEPPEGPDAIALLQEAQMRAIPFETVDAFLGSEPRVTSGGVADKILRDGRGGWCFELNRLLQDGLEALGFRVERRLARVRMGAGRGGARTHLALVVTLGERWLVDAGFGGPGPLRPLRLDSDADQPAPNGVYRLSDDTATGERVLWRRDPAGDFALYGLDAAPVFDPDVVAASFFCSHWPDSRFRHELMVTGHDGAARLGLRNRLLTGEGAPRLLRDMGELTHILRDRLKLRLDEAQTAALWDRTG